MGKDIAAIATLVVSGVIVADVLAHADAVKAAGGVLVSVLRTSFTAMLGTVPSA